MTSVKKVPKSLYYVEWTINGNVNTSEPMNEEAANGMATRLGKAGCKPKVRADKGAVK